MIIEEMAGSDRVALEVEGEGTQAIPFGSIPAGGPEEGEYCGVYGVSGG